MSDIETRIHRFKAAIRVLDHGIQGKEEFCKNLKPEDPKRELIEFQIDRYKKYKDTYQSKIEQLERDAVKRELELRKSPNMKLLVAIDEDNNHTYYDASDQQAWAKSALKILTERFKNHQYDDSVAKSIYVKIREVVQTEDIFFTGPEDDREPKAWSLLKSVRDLDGHWVEMDQVIQVTEF